MKLTPNCCAPTKNSASRCKSGKCLPALRLMPSLTPSRSPPASKTALAKKASSSAPSPKQCANTPNWCANTSARWCAWTITTSPRSTPPSSAMARFATSRPACAARWNSPPTSASTPPTPASLSAPSSSPIKALTSPTSKAAPRRNAKSTSCTPPSSKSSPTKTRR